MHGEVGRNGAAVDDAGGLVVGKRRRETVRQPAGALEHLALIVGAVLDLVFGGDRGRLLAREARTARLGEIAEREQGEAVADSSRPRDRP